MIWKITFLLTCFSVSIKAPTADPDFPGESSLSDEIPKEHLEDLYNVAIVQSIIGMPTLDKKEFDFDHDDVTLLTTECLVDEVCLNNKKASVQKFHQKIQAIQCVNGLYVLKVLDKVKSIMADMVNNSTLIFSLKEQIREYKFYLASMLTLIHMAKWDAYSWQIEIFTFLSGLEPWNVSIEMYAEHYEKHYPSMREKVLALVDRCFQQAYIMSVDDTTTENSAIFQFTESMYKTDDVIKLSRFYYNVPKLMLKHLYSWDDFIFVWSNPQIKLDTSHFNRQTRKQLGFYWPDNLIDKWILDPIGGIKYHALVAKHIHLRAEYLAWYHLYAFHTLLDRLRDGTEENSYYKQLVISSWKLLAPKLKCILRAVWFDENIYWSSINVMMADLTSISKEDLAVRERFTRNYFCQSVEDLGLGSASDMNLRLQNVELPKDYVFIYYGVLAANVKKASQFCVEIKRVPSPNTDGFIRILLGAKGNQTFVTRKKI